jgi:hypothetical protein
MEEFEPKEPGENAAGEVEEALPDAIRYWFRDFCRVVERDVIPHVRCEAWERVRILASILRARDPDAARMWGLRAANDNSPI